MEALETHGISLYLRRILRSYLSDRTLQFVDESGKTIRRGVNRGIPQGSILGPLLWNLGYDAVLRNAELAPDCSVICYADDTIILASGDDWQEAVLKANEAVVSVLEQINST